MSAISTWSLPSRVCWADGRRAVRTCWPGSTPTKADTSTKSPECRRTVRPHHERAKHDMIGRRGAVVGGLAALTGGCSPAALLNATVPRTGYTLEADLAYGRLPRQRLDYYAPAAPRADGKTVVFFYGGAWRQGDKADYLFLGQALASRGIGVVIADYRLFPDVRYPAFIQDGALAVGWSARRFG